jgi:Ser/Thr protein kinase RdoA (MazF antagonist)
MSGALRILRVMKYMQGDLLKSDDPSSAQLRQVGKTLARLDHALKDFSHDHDDRLLIWDLKHFHRLRGLLEFLVDPRKLAIAESIFDQFENAVTPRMNSLRSQALHGDFSPFNVVVNASSEDYVVGIIDFGDTVHSPVIFDVSVAMANQLGANPQEPWRRALDVLAGYRSEYPLEPDEAALLSIAAPARLLLRALLAEWRASHSPDSRDYLLSHSAGDWERLYAAMAVPSELVRSAIHKDTFSPSH